MMKRNNEMKKGFTLVELAIVIAVLAVFAVVMIRPITGVLQSAKNSADMQDIKSYLENELAEFVMSERSSPKGITFERGTDSDSLSYKNLTFTSESKDMYEIMETNDFTMYTTTCNITNGVSKIVINGTTKYFNNPNAVINSGATVLYVNKYPDRLYINGLTYNFVSTVSAVEVTTVQNTDVKTVYMPVAAQTVDNTVDTEKEIKYVDCDYIYTVGKNGYVFKIVVYKGTYEVIETEMDVDEFMEKYGYIDVSDFTNYSLIKNEGIVGTSIEDMMRATMKRTAIFSNTDTNVTVIVERNSSKFTNAAYMIFVSGTPTDVYLGDKIKITVKGTTSITITDIKLEGVSKLSEFTQDGLNYTYEFTVTDTVLMNIGVIYSINA